MNDNYDKVLERVVKVSGLDKEEIERRVEAKQAKLSGLISKEGALQVISAELGISFENEKSKIEELLPGMRKVNVIGKVIRLFPVRTFTTKKGDEGKVANLFIADDTSNIKVVLWDTNHIDLIEKGMSAEDKSIEIIGGSMRDNEIHLGSFSELKLSDVTFDNLVTERVSKEKNIVDFGLSDNVKTRAFIVQVFEPKFFNVCSECKKKVTPEGDGFACAEHGKMVPEKRALINVVLDDGTESMRSVVFHDKLSELGITELDNQELFSQQKQNLLGKEMVFSGNVRRNSFFNNPELIIDGVSEVNLDELVNKLEAE
jgi:replication factor A1